MAVFEPDYDADPGRWRAWRSPRDVHETVARELRGPVLDVGCGEGRLASLLGPDVSWTGLDSSAAQLAANPHRPLVRADMRRLPFPDESFAEVTHLWCLYHVEDPLAAVAEALRVLVGGGRYFACTSARDNDPEIVPDGYPASSFDAEDAAGIVGELFDSVQVERWDAPLVVLDTPAQVRAYCRHHRLPSSLADGVQTPLTLTKRGVLVRATKRPVR